MHTEKNITISLTFLSIFSCKKAQSDSENLITSKEIIVNKEWNRDSDEVYLIYAHLS